MRTGGRCVVRHLRLLAVAFVCLLLAVSAGAQQPAEPPAAVDYQAMLRSGGAQFENGDYVGAIGTWERLLQSIGEARGWKVLYNLGLAYEAVGDATYAMDRYGAFVRNVEASTEPAREGIAERKADAIERMNRIRASHGQVRVRPAPGAIVLVRVDGGPERAAGFTAWLLPGEHRVDLGCGTDALHHITILVEAGRTSEVVTSEPPVRAPPLAPLAPSTAAQRPTASVAVASRKPFPTSWVLAGTGAAAVSIVLPVALGVRAKHKRDDAIALGPGNTRYSAAYDDYESARRAYKISYVLPATFAAVTLGIAGYHWFSGGNAGAVKAAAVVSPGGGRLWAFGTF